MLAKKFMQPAPWKGVHFSYPVARKAKEKADKAGLSSVFSSSTASPLSDSPTFHLNEKLTNSTYCVFEGKFSNIEMIMKD